MLITHQSLLWCQPGFGEEPKSVNWNYCASLEKTTSNYLAESSCPSWLYVSNCFDICILKVSRCAWSYRSRIRWLLPFFKKYEEIILLTNHHQILGVVLSLEFAFSNLLYLQTAVNLLAIKVHNNDSSTLSINASLTYFLLSNSSSNAC